MEHQNMKLGKVLAHLRLVDEFPDDINFIQKFDDQDELVSFKNRLKHLTASQDRNVLIEKLDHNECCFESPFLKGNSDIFLLLLFQKEIPELCSSLGKHLNDCYHCFQIFSQVMQDYYQEYQTYYCSI
ncbi:MAG: hypothetical protein JW956_00925 [Calditrichaceae bacterium]|nr:hypothetical protein [Calditrichaceae bacterium]